MTAVQAGPRPNYHIYAHRGFTSRNIQPSLSEIDHVAAGDSHQSVWGQSTVISDGSGPRSLVYGTEKFFRPYRHTHFVLCELPLAQITWHLYCLKLTRGKKYSSHKF